jgi:hypothetical protein
MLNITLLKEILKTQNTNNQQFNKKVPFFVWYYVLHNTFQ